MSQSSLAGARRPDSASWERQWGPAPLPPRPRDSLCCCRCRCFCPCVLLLQLPPSLSRLVYGRT
jgi:hypothetical protein